MTRAAHYADFYDPDAAWRRTDLPTLAVVGNCQAEALRLLLGSEDSADLVTARIPPVHEWVEADLAPLARLLERVDVLVTQPVTDDYRGLPVGLAQLREWLARHRPQTRVVVVPAIRYAGLHPWHLVVHPPGLVDPDPPLVAYHDVRVAVAAAWLASGRSDPPPAGHLTSDVVRRVATDSLAELRRRERAADAVVVSDLLERPTFASMRTVNHPGNALLGPLAARVRAALGLPARPPGITRPVLDAVHAPRDPVVAGVFEPDVAAQPHWRVDGREVSMQDVAAAQTRWYAARPDVLDVVLARTAHLRRDLDLALPGDEHR